MRAARDTRLHFSLQQPDNASREIRQGCEAALAGQPGVVDEDHEGRHERDEHQGKETSSYGREDGGDAIEDVARGAPDGTRVVSVAGAHGRPFRGSFPRWNQPVRAEKRTPHAYACGPSPEAQEWDSRAAPSGRSRQGPHRPQAPARTATTAEPPIPRRTSRLRCCALD